MATPLFFSIPIMLFAVSSTLVTAAEIEKLNQLLTTAVIVITERHNLGSETGNFFSCADFAMSADEIKAFLIYATPITAREQQDKFAVRSCEVKGKAVTGQGEFVFSIRHGGTGSLIYNDQEILLGCLDDCCKAAQHICE